MKRNLSIDLFLYVLECINSIPFKMKINKLVLSQGLRSWGTLYDWGIQISKEDCLIFLSHFTPWCYMYGMSRKWGFARAHLICNSLSKYFGKLGGPSCHQFYWTMVGCQNLNNHKEILPLLMLGNWTDKHYIEICVAETQNWSFQWESDR